MNSQVVWLMAGLLWTALATGAGWLVGSEREVDRCTARITTIKAEQASNERDAAQTALDRLQQAQARGDALESRLATAEAARKTTQEEHAREIKRLTTGRLCLDAGTVRLLNEPAGAGVATLSAPAGGAVAAGAAAASDTDVALWIDGAKRQYGTCRDRLDALIDWHEGEQAGER